MPELPTTFGKYFLTEKLATGGMAEIYLAKLLGPGGFEKQLVLKQIHPRLSGQRHFVDLFVAEAKTLVTLTHGNIVPVYELGVIDDTYFIAMDYIDGPTLYRFTESLARRGAVLEPAIAAWIGARILEGLDYAHRKGEGVIHRDLSPRNVMLSRDGEVKLVDFGIAVTLGAAGEDADAHSAPTGSFPYMSPEQARREPLTGQTDLFSVGVLLWEMLVGERLFARPDPEATLAAVTSGEIPRPSARRAQIPARLDEVVMRALERDTARRWASAAEMLGALQKYLYALDGTPGPRDVAALVARYCPPETRRLPTHADAVADAAGDEDGHATPTSLVSGPATAVIPRDGGRPRRARAPTRQESFATHVQLKDMLERTTPVPPPMATPPPSASPAEPARRDADEGPTTAAAPRPASTNGTAPATAVGPRAAAADGTAPATAVAPRPVSAEGTGPSTAVAPPPERTAGEAPGRLRARSVRGEPEAVPPPEQPAGDAPGRDRAHSVPESAPVGRGLLVVAGLGATALAGAAVVVFLRGRDAVLTAGDGAVEAAPADAAGAPAVTDAVGVLRVDAGLADALPVGEPGRPLDAPPRDLDAGLRPDPRRPRDTPAAPRPTPGERRDAGTPRPDARDGRRSPPDPAPTGTALLHVGADPWGEIVIDGVRRGRTPARIEVPAGRHVVEVIFAGEDPPRTRSFKIDVAAGATQELVADFTRP